MKDKDQPTSKDRLVGFLVYPWELDDYAAAEKVLPLLERLHYLGYAVIVASPYLKTTTFYTWDRQIINSLIKKADVMLLCHEEHMTRTMLNELMKGREYGKQVVRIVRKVE